MTDRDAAADIFREAARLNREESIRNGSLLEFPDYGQLVMTGDLHGHRRNYEKIVRYCDLEHAGARHVILHELIHEELTTADGLDRSHEVLVEAARWKCAFPDQVHFLMGNHELAQINRHEITKNGHIVTLRFEESVCQAYGKQAPGVLAAIESFLRSFSLAGRTQNRVFVSHSLPGPRELAKFDARVLTRSPDDQDFGVDSSVHYLVWGRYQNKNTIEKVRELLDVDFIICGHQPQDTGYDVLHDRMVILASDHNHGVLLPIDLNRQVTLDGLTRRIRPLAGIT